ncbi:hypothetical protein [Bacillus thuringiensis]|uniref:hypothetical protein n=1 Tax=Bacillus thuringiensis TaxID=1428 RepID=UPI000BEB9F9C|nr:hypothetical protein [Bacillus thuringiensis]MED4447124.1 hypothetical protein [Bacillus cereus]PEB44564.1 hypothetical protein COM82_27335 [Bacillus thuringiensis]PED25754.1 hypothetical protein CON34_13805 [Bacillus thuringiensis]PFL01453.1 hypothetical protein COJ28_29500 [Bacillus thuringiensis]PGU34984.1 hypothetical protein COD63_30295 [Bacillus thuringiensis]
MIINKVAVGNAEEAYIEENFRDSLNIISSDDNNKGKTIMIQSLLYCLGNVPVFPSSFEYKKYHHIIEFHHNENYFTLCRTKDYFILKTDESILLFDNVSEMKRYWSKNISELPKIIKNDRLRIVDPELFTQLFFVGQDKKDSSNIANKGFYTKLDFYNMLYAYKGLGLKGLSPVEVSMNKEKLSKLKEERKVLLKQHKILNSKKVSANYLSQHSDRVAFEDKVKQIERIKEKISELRISRNLTINRKTKCEITLKELKSLNRTISTGELQCLDCNSKHIGYASNTNSPYAFDVSTSEVRNQIINSINGKIASYIEEIEKQTVEINQYQKQFQEMLMDESISLESIIMYKQDVIDSAGIEDQVNSLEKEMHMLKDSLKANEESNQQIIEQQNDLISKIIKEMNVVYKKIDATGTLVFDDIFTKKTEIFSGSEATEFHLSKMYVLAKVLQHPYPIIVDSFRAEDLSTDREKVVIDLFDQLNNQIIFTTTLKKEEVGKYNALKKINHIDYSSHTPSKILSKKFADEFISLASKLMIEL